MLGGICEGIPVEISKGILYEIPKEFSLEKKKNVAGMLTRISKIKARIF